MFDLNKKNVGGADVYGLLQMMTFILTDGSLITSLSEAESLEVHSST